jgi:hypothetical protein
MRPLLRAPMFGGAGYYRARRARQQRGAAPAPPPTTIDQLTKLARLKEQGVLTNEEFDTQKRKLLSGP